MEIIEYGILFAIGWMLAPTIITISFMIFGVIIMTILAGVKTITNLFASDEI